jgi:hypothetical protein
MSVAFANADTTITPLPYSLATTTGWKAQETTYGNALLPLDLEQFIVDENVEDFVLDIYLQQRTGDVWTNGNNYFVALLGHYDGSDHDIVYSEPFYQDDTGDIFLASFSFPTTTLTDALDYWFKIFYLNSATGLPVDVSYQGLQMFSYNGSNPTATAIKEIRLAEPPVPDPALTWENPAGGLVYGSTLNWGQFSWENAPLDDYEYFNIIIAISTSTDYGDPFVVTYGWTPSIATEEFAEAGSSGAVWGANDFQTDLTTTTQVYGLAYLVGQNGTSTTLLAEGTSTWQFMPFLYGEVYPTSTDVCDPEGNFLLYGLCRLFIPSNGSVWQFQALKTDLENKPPFGYFNSFREVIDNLSTSTASAIPFPDLSLANEQVFTPLKTGISWLLWFMFGFWGFDKFRNFKF